MSESDLKENEPLVTAPRSTYTDDRGEILNLVDIPFQSASVITSHKGSVRANHYHLSDYHYCWLQTGAMTYAERRVGSDLVRRQLVRAGEIVVTRPMYEHAMYFTADSVMFCCARNNRETENYEADTVRVPPLPVESRPD